MAYRGNDSTENEPLIRSIREYVRPKIPKHVSTPMSLTCPKAELGLGHYNEENYLYDDRTPVRRPAGNLHPKRTTPVRRPAGNLHPKGTTPVRRPAGNLHPKGTTPVRRPAGNLYPKGTTLVRRPAGNLHPKGTTLVRRPAGNLHPKGTIIQKPLVTTCTRSTKTHEENKLLGSSLSDKENKLLESSLQDKEIQGHPYLKNKLSHYETFHDFKVVKAVNGEKVQQALRVVQPDSTGDLGTIVNVDEDGKVTVEWDRPCKTRQVTFEKEDNNQYSLLLYDNTQAGVIHDGVKCETCELFPIPGIRWACFICDVNLCTKCYMGDEHRIDHVFIRIISPHSKGVEMPLRLKGKKIKEDMTSRLDVKPKKIFSPLKASGTRGTVKDSERSMTSVAVELTCWESFYPGHLPVLGQCSDGYFNVRIDDCELPNTDQIRIYLWQTIHKEMHQKKMTLQPSLYLIFANSEGDDQFDKISLMKEISTFAETSKLPCHVIGQRVMFHSGSTHNVCIHYKTDKDTIKELIKNGYKKFSRGSIVENDDDDNEIAYFKRMAEYAIGQTVFPVIISIRKGWMKTEVLVKKNVANLHIPVIRLEKDTSKAYVMWFSEDYQAETKTPWRVNEIKKKGNFDTSDEIALLSDIRWKIETLVCSLIIGVYMEKESSKEIPCETHDYVTALSMYLLKKGMWRIPKNYIKKTLGQISLGYICQKVITPDLIKELWKNFSDMGYKLPDYRELQTNKADSDHDSLRRIAASAKGPKIQLTNWNSECYGFIFFALLQKHYWAGATQLVETGYIGIHDILFGCVLLDEYHNNWKTTKLVKEEIQLLKNAFTERAIRITSCIYNADTKPGCIENDTSVGKRDGRTANDDGLEIFEETEDAGRLLLNHGYLRDAINFKNNTYLENDTVKKIVNSKWYGIEKINCQTICSFVLLSAVHLFVLPMLMINLEARPLLRLYKNYKLPFLKVVIQMMGFLVLILAYAYMLLFDYSDDGISNTDWLIILWIASFFVDEIKQVIVACIRDKMKRYTSDWWNRLDWLLIIIYTSGMILRIGEGSGFHAASKCVLVAAFMLLCIRILNLCCMTKLLGPKLVIIRKMVKETIAFMIIMTVIMVWYSVSFYALLYPNSEFTWTQIEKVLSKGYWMLFGELNLDGDTLTVPDCTFNRTVYEIGVLQRCPTQLGLYLTPYLKAFYGLIAVVLLLNLLIAMYSDTFNAVQQKSDFYWRKIQSDCLEEYSIKTIFPIHLQLLALPGTICALLCVFNLYLRRKSTGKWKLDDGPMIVRVFLYDTSYDLELQSTKQAEENAKVDTNTKIDLTELDNIMKPDILNDGDDKQNPKLLKRLKSMENSINLLQLAIEQLVLKEKDDDDSIEEVEAKGEKKVIQ